MIPIKDYVRTKSFPVVNGVFIAVNLVVFVRQLLLPQPEALEFVMEYAFVADRFLASPGEYWFTPLTTIFFHGGFVHFIGNMLFLLVFGDNVEDALGHLRYLVFYLAAGVVSLGVQLVVSPELSAPVIGASGAISAVLGVYLVLYPLARVTTLIPIGIFLMPVRLPAFIFLGVWALVQFFSGYFVVVGGAFDAVAYFAHIGGFAFGFLLALFVRDRLIDRLRKRGHVPYRRR